MKERSVFPLILLLLTLFACASSGGGLQDGLYSVKVTLSGGSGRATVASPAKLTVADGKMTAVIEWSSPYYEYMRVGGVTYYPVNTDGNSTFEIPVTPDTDMAVTAETVAMSEPHEIDYTLHFDSATLKPLGRHFPIVPVLAGVGAAVLIIISACVFLRKKRRRENRG